MAKRVLGPHALAVVQAVRAAVDSATGVVVGCSGGPDSLALAAGVAHAGVPARAVVVDHRLQAGSRAVAERVRVQLEPRGLPVEIVPVEVPESPSGPEASARAARYAALTSAMRPQELLLLGHTRDDQAEQVLLGLARGSGARSLAGIPPVRDLPGEGRLARPLLHLRRADTEAACAEWGLDPWHDPHNADPSFTRVRVRDIVLPHLEEQLGPGITDALARTADQIREDADLLDRLTDEHMAAHHLHPIPDALPVHTLDAPTAITTRVLRRWLIHHGAKEPGHGHVQEVLRLVTDWHGQKSVHVPGLKVGRSRGHLQVMSD